MNMSRFQVILIGLLVFVLLSFFRRFNKPAIDKIIILILGIVGIFFTIYPELTNKLAHYLGIGRGVDMIFYLVIVGFGYGILLLYVKIKSIESKLDNIVRKQALDAAKLTEKNG